MLQSDNVNNSGKTNIVVVLMPAPHMFCIEKLQKAEHKQNFCRHEQLRGV